jgi:xylan 1,4-beta-xylosidase
MESLQKDLVFLFCLLFGTLLLTQKAQAQQTFCNPLNLNYRFMADAVDAREAADPVILIFEDDYYLFASRSGGYWTSTDLNNWTLIVPTGVDIETYAPAAIVMRDTVFYTPSASSQIYKSGDPKSGIWEAGPRIGSYGDPALFLDDDGRLYMYYGLSNNAPTGVVELDPYTFQEISDRNNIVFAQASIHGWERRGDDNLLDEVPWIEGSWMIKENDTYYLHYAGPGTEFKTYADGIYTATSPMGPFEYESYSPFSFKPTGFISGAGHGNTFKDKDGQYWHIGTMTISVKHMFERRLDLAPVSFDEEGHIHCSTAFGDYPQYLPGVKENMIDESFAGMMLLSHKKYAMASSSIEGHGIEYAVDEEVRTYWCAQTGGSNEWMMIDLGKECSVQAIQVNFAEDHTNPALVRGRNNLLYEQYTLKKSLDGMSWDMLVDKSQNMEDVPHDYIELDQPATARYIKVSNIYVPGGGNFAVRDLRIFGNADQAVFTKVDVFTIERSEADGRDANLSWSSVTNADGYIIRYGIAADKLYNNYMVYDTTGVSIHSLNHGVDYYFEVEAFDSGTDYYKPVGEIRSNKSGTWNDVDTWERYDGSNWQHPAPAVPAISDGVITILDGHKVTVTVADSADQLVVASGGTLIINKDVTFLVKNGIETDLMVEGTIKNYGSLTSDAQATVSFVNTGTYLHKQDGGTIPTAQWRPASTCVMDTLQGIAPANGNQNFYNLLWNCPEQSENLSLDWDGNTIGGDIIVQNTGSGQFQMCMPEAGNTAVVNINGDIIQTTGQFTATGTSNANTTITINQSGNLNIMGGVFSICSGSQAGSGTTTWILTSGNVSLENCTTQNTNSAGATFVFRKEGEPQMLSFSDVTFAAGGFPVEVDSGATLDIGTSILQGDGSFNLKEGGTLQTAHAGGVNGSIANTGTKTFDQGAGYNFNGITAQMTGTLMPGIIANLLINNEQDVTLSNAVQINGILEMQSGALNNGANEVSYGPDGTLKYSGGSAQTTTDVEFPIVNGPANLIVRNTRGVTLHASRIIKNLDVAGKLIIGANTLLLDSASVADQRSYVDTRGGGHLSIGVDGPSPVFFPVGTTAYAPVWITRSGSSSLIGVSAETDLTPAPGGGRIRVIWTIDETNADGGEYTIQFGWTSSLEDAAFKRDRENNAKIYNLSDTTEAGTGSYSMQFESMPYTVSRGGITELGPFTVGVFDKSLGTQDASNSVPLVFSLSQNYPNPFNPKTVIRYALPVTCHIDLGVYNLLGQKVATLVSEKQRAGRHQVQWDASGFASGIYYYKIHAGEFQQVRKMVLIR